MFLAFAMLVSSQPTLAQRNEPARKDRPSGREQVRRPSEPRRETPQRPSTQTPTRRIETSSPRQNRSMPTQIYRRPSTTIPSRTIPGRRPEYRPQVYHRQIYVPRRPAYRPPYRPPHRPVVYSYYRYHYHPYIPYYDWGYRWHPIGTFFDVLATTAIIVGFAATVSEINREERIYYDDGVFYQQEDRGYAVIAPPLGAIVPDLPDDTYEFSAEGIPYYYYAGVFYTEVENGYQVVQAPLGAIVSKLPPGATEVKINGMIYYFFNETYYQPIDTEDGPAYQVVDL